MQFTNYSNTLMCFSMSMSSDISLELIEKLNHSNKILLPSNILQELINVEVKLPVFFQLENTETGYKHSCGVHEFTSQPGTCFIPYRIMGCLCINEGDNINITLIQPEKGTDVKLKIISKDFLKLTNPKVVLEKTLSENYPIISLNESLSINYNNNVYEILITECKPIDTIQIIDVDLNVDFDSIDEKKEDIKEINENSLVENKEIKVNNNIFEDNNVSNKKESELNNYKKDKTFVAFSGKGYTLGTK